MSTVDKRMIRNWVRQEGRLGRRVAMPSIMAGIVSAILGVLQAWLMARLIAIVLTHQSAHAAIEIGELAIVFVLRALCAFLQEKQAVRAGVASRKRLRTAFLERIVSQGPSLLRREHSAGIVGMIVERVDLLDGYFSRYVSAATLAAAAPLIVLIGVLMFAPSAAWIFILCGIAVPFAQAVFGIGAARASRRQFLAMMRLQVRFLDRVRGIATVVLANAQEREALALARSADDLRRRTMQILRVAFVSSAAIDVATVIAIIGVVVHFRAGLTGGASLPVLTAALVALLLVPEFFAPLRIFALAYQDRAQASSTAESMLTLDPEAVEARTDGPELTHGVTITAQDVGYHWERDRGDVFTHLNFSVSTGQILVLDGPSGAGKSTIMELLLGFILPTSGRLTLNGHDINDMAPSALARSHAWIGQRPVLFAGTLRDNILFARPQASDDDLAAALDDSAVSHFLNDLPDGLDTVIGEGGFGLSGGQAQRVAIARAFLKGAPVLLMDEPTSHLDPETEQTVIRALLKFGRARTVVLSSHSAALKQVGTHHLRLPQCTVEEAAA